MKKKFIAIILILIIIGAGVYLFLNRKKENPNELTLYGNIEIRQVDLSFQVGGKLSKMFKDLDKANANVAQTTAIKKDADDKFTRNAPLVGDDTISKQDYETLLNTKNKSAADLKAAVAQKNYAQNQLNYTKLYAPDDGIIMVRVQEPGATVAKGQAVYTMAKTKPVWVRAYVNETDLGNIKYGQQVSVYTDTIDPATGKKREYKGQIGYISPVAEFTPKTVQSTDTRTNLVYRMRVYIYDIDEFLRQGMPVTINVDLTKGKAKKR